MAKDDYDVIVYKILLYYYAIMKRKIVYSEESFQALLSKADIPDEYLADVLRMMQSEGLIEGAVIVKAWGHDYIISSDKMDISITADGIRYLKENATMKRIAGTLKEIPGLVSTLIGIVKPF